MESRPQQNSIFCWGWFFSIHSILRCPSVDLEPAMYLLKGHTNGFIFHRLQQIHLQMTTYLSTKDTFSKSMGSFGEINLCSGVKKVNKNENFEIICKLSRTKKQNLSAIAARTRESIPPENSTATLAWLQPWEPLGRKRRLASSVGKFWFAYASRK